MQMTRGRAVNHLAAGELERIPRGNLAQNLYRAAYQQARLNALGARPEVGPTEADAHALALRIVRIDYPAFTPALLE
jgi:hypothetical protein